MHQSFGSKLRFSQVSLLCGLFYEDQTRLFRFSCIPLSLFMLSTRHCRVGKYFIGEFGNITLYVEIRFVYVLSCHQNSPMEDRKTVEPSFCFLGIILGTRHDFWVVTQT